MGLLKHPNDMSAFSVGFLCVCVSVCTVGL